MSNLRQLVEEACKHNGDDVARVVWWIQRRDPENHCVFLPAIECVTIEQMPTNEIDCGYGGADGAGVIGFSDDFIYFWGVYDGSQWIESVPRHGVALKNWKRSEWDDAKTPWVGGG